MDPAAGAFYKIYNTQSYFFARQLGLLRRGLTHRTLGGGGVVKLVVFPSIVYPRVRVFASCLWALRDDMRRLWSCRRADIASRLCSSRRCIHADDARSTCQNAGAPHGSWILACGPRRRLQHAIVQCDIAIRGLQRVCAARRSQCRTNGSADEDCCALPERLGVRARQASNDEQPNMGTDRVASCGSFNSIGFEFRQSQFGSCTDLRLFSRIQCARLL